MTNINFKKTVISILSLLVFTMLLIVYTVANADEDSDNFIKDKSEKLGSEKNPYVILEIVPDKAYAEIGYLVKGQEPININDNIHVGVDNVSEIIKSLSGAIDITSTRKDELNLIQQTGHKNYVDTTMYTDNTVELVDGYYTKVGSNSGEWKANYSSLSDSTSYFAQSWEPISNQGIYEYNYVYVTNKKAYYTIPEGEYSNIYRNSNNGYISKNTDIANGVDTEQYDYAYKKLINNYGNYEYVLISNISSDRYRKCLNASNIVNFEYVGNGNGDWKFNKAYDFKEYSFNNDTLQWEYSGYTKSSDYISTLNIYNKQYDMGEGTRVRIKSCCTLGNSTISDFSFKNNDKFKTDVIGIKDASKLDSYNIKVLVKTPDELTTDILDKCNFIYFNDGGDTDSYRYSTIVKLYKMAKNKGENWEPLCKHLSNENLVYNISDEFISKLYSLIIFGSDKIEYESYVDNETTSLIEKVDNNNKPVVVFDSALYDNVLKNYNNSICYNNITKLYVLCNEMYPTVYYKNFIKPYISTPTSTETVNNINLSKLHVGKTYYNNSKYDVLAKGIDKHMLWPLSINNKYDDIAGYIQMGIDNPYLSEEFVVEHSVLSFNSNSEKNILYAFENSSISKTKTTEEAFVKLNDNKIIDDNIKTINVGLGLHYLVKYQKTNTIMKPTLNIVDVEPCNAFTNEDMWKWKICGFAPYYLGTIKPFDTITSQMPMNQFIGISKKPNEAFDLVYIGDKADAMNTMVTNNSFIDDEYDMVVSKGETKVVPLSNLIKSTYYDEFTTKLKSNNSDIAEYVLNSDNSINITGIKQGIDNITINADIIIGDTHLNKDFKVTIYVSDDDVSVIDTDGTIDNTENIIDITNLTQNVYYKVKKGQLIYKLRSPIEETSDTKYYTYDYVIGANKNTLYRLDLDEQPGVEYQIIEVTDYKNGLEAQFANIVEGESYSLVAKTNLANKQLTYNNVVFSQTVFGFSKNQRIFKTSSKCIGLIVNIKTDNVSIPPSSIKIQRVDLNIQYDSLINQNPVTYKGDVINIVKNVDVSESVTINPYDYINKDTLNNVVLKQAKLYRVEYNKKLTNNWYASKPNNIMYITRSTQRPMVVHLYFEYEVPGSSNKEYSSILIHLISNKDYGTDKTDPYETIYNDETLNGLLYMHIGDKYNIVQLRTSDGFFDGAIQKNGTSDIDAGLIGTTFDTRFSGNDLTKKKMLELEEFLDASMPVVIADSLLNISDSGDILGSNEDRVDNSSYLYEFINNNKDRLIYETESVSGIWDKAFSKAITLDVKSKPTLYYNTSKVVDDSVYLAERKLKYEIDIITSISNDNYNYAADLYIDGNCDGIFSASEKIYGLYITDEEGNIVNSRKLKANNQTYTITRAIPEQFIGVINWKLIVYRTDNDSIRKCIEGVSALKTKEEDRPDIVVLQLLPSSNHSGASNTSSSGTAYTSLSLNIDSGLYKYKAQGTNNSDDKFYSYASNVQDFNIKCMSRTELDLINADGEIDDILAYKVNTKIYYSDEFISSNLVDGYLVADNQKFSLSRNYYPNNNNLAKSKVTVLNNVNTIYNQGTELLSLEEAASSGYDYSEYLAQNLQTQVDGKIYKEDGTYLGSGTYYVVRYIQGVGFSEIYDYDNGNENLGDDSEVLGFDMIMTGVCDSGTYSRAHVDDSVKDSVLDKIVEHDAQGKTLLLTHDTISFSALNCSSLTSDSNANYGYKNFLALKDVASIDRYATDVPWTPRSNRSEIIPTQGWSNASVLSTNCKRASGGFNPDNPQYVPYYSRGKLQAAGTGSYNLSSNNINMTVTRYAEVVNRGQITEYPYHINDVIQTASTHFQYWQLDLEQDMAVWMTLKQTFANNSTGTGDLGGYINYNRDTRNNYYIYSKENIVYTGIGHTGGFTEDEIKLFVNTIVSSYRNKSTGSTLVVNDNEASVYGSDTYIYIDSDYGNIDQDIIVDATNNQKLRFNIVDNNLVTNSKITLELGDANSGVDMNDINVKNFTSLTTPLNNFGNVDIYSYTTDINDATLVENTESGYRMDPDLNYYMLIPQDIIEWAAQKLLKSNSNSYTIYARLSLDSSFDVSSKYGKKTQSLQRIIFIKRGLFMLD